MLMYGKCECFVMQMFLSSVHPLAILNAAFCMTFSLLILIENLRIDHIEQVYTRSGLTSVSFCLPHPVVASYFIISRGCVCVLL